MALHHQPRSISSTSRCWMLGSILLALAAMDTVEAGCSDIGSSTNCCGRVCMTGSTFNYCEANELACDFGCPFYGGSCTTCTWCSIGYCKSSGSCPYSTCLAATANQGICNEANSCSWCSTVGYCSSSSCYTSCGATPQTTCTASHNCKYCSTLGGWCGGSSLSCVTACHSLTSRGSVTCNSASSCQWCSTLGGWCSTNSESCVTECLSLTTRGDTKCSTAPDCKWCNTLGGWCATNAEVCVTDCQSLTPRGSIKCTTAPTCQWCTEHNGRCKPDVDLCLTETGSQSKTHTISSPRSQTVSFSQGLSLTPSASQSPSFEAESATPTVSASPVASTSPTTSESPSPSSSQSPTVSTSPSTSTSNSPTDSPTTEHTVSDSSELSLSSSATPQLSLTASPTFSDSPVLSQSATPSDSPTATTSPSPTTSLTAGTVTAELSKSVSQTLTSSRSPTQALSGSQSSTPAVSVSASPTVSDSPMKSLSPSASGSTSIQRSTSATPTTSQTGVGTATSSESASAASITRDRATRTAAVSISTSASRHSDSATGLPTASLVHESKTRRRSLTTSPSTWPTSSISWTVSAVHSASMSNTQLATPSTSASDLPSLSQSTTGSQDRTHSEATVSESPTSTASVSLSRTPSAPSLTLQPSVSATLLHTASSSSGVSSTRSITTTAGSATDARTSTATATGEGMTSTSSRSATVTSTVIHPSHTLSTSLSITATPVPTPSNSPSDEASASGSASRIKSHTASFSMPSLSLQLSPSATVTTTNSREVTTTISTSTSESHSRNSLSSSRQSSATTSLGMSWTSSMEATNSSTDTARNTQSASVSVLRSLSSSTSAVLSRSASHPSNSASHSWQHGSMSQTQSSTASVTTSISNSSIVTFSTSISLSGARSCTIVSLSASASTLRTASGTARTATSERSVSLETPTMEASNTATTIPSTTPTPSRAASTSVSASPTSSKSHSHVALSMSDSTSLSPLASASATPIRTPTASSGDTMSDELPVTMAASLTPSQVTPSTMPSASGSTSDSASFSQDVTRATGSMGPSRTDGTSLSRTILRATASPSLWRSWTKTIHLSMSPSAMHSHSSTDSPSTTRSPTISTSVTVSRSRSRSTSTSRSPSQTLTPSVSASTSSSPSSSTSQTGSKTPSPTSTASRSIPRSTTTSHSAGTATGGASQTASVSLAATSTMTSTVHFSQPYPIVVTPALRWLSHAVPVVAAENSTLVMVDIYPTEADGSVPMAPYRSPVELRVSSRMDDVVVHRATSLAFPDDVGVVVLPCRVYLSILIGSTRCAWTELEHLNIHVTYRSTIGASYGTAPVTHTTTIAVESHPQTPSVPQQTCVGATLGSVGVAASVRVLAADVPQEVVLHAPCWGGLYGAVSISVGTIESNSQRADTTLHVLSELPWSPVTFIVSAASWGHHDAKANVSVFVAGVVVLQGPPVATLTMVASVDTAVATCSAVVVQQLSTIPHVLMSATSGNASVQPVLVPVPTTSAASATTANDAWRCEYRSPDDAMLYGVASAVRADGCHVLCSMPPASLGAACVHLWVVSAGADVVARFAAVLWVLPTVAPFEVGLSVSNDKGVRIAHNTNNRSAPTVLTVAANAMAHGRLPQVDVALTTTGGHRVAVPLASVDGLKAMLWTIAMVDPSTNDSTIVYHWSDAGAAAVKCSATTTGFVVPPVPFMGSDAPPVDTQQRIFRYNVSLVAAERRDVAVLLFDMHLAPAVVCTHSALTNDTAQLDDTVPTTLLWDASGCNVPAFPVTGRCRGGERIVISIRSVLPLERHAATPAASSTFDQALLSVGASDVAIDALFENSLGHMLSLPCTDIAMGNTSTPDQRVEVRCSLPTSSAIGTTSVTLRMMRVATGAVLADFVGAASYSTELRCAGLLRPCNDHGICLPSDECECFDDAVNGHWRGQDCATCRPGYYGATCLSVCPGADCIACSGHGACSDGLDGTGACACYDADGMGHWASPDCSECKDGFFGSSCTNPCPRNDATGAVCSGNGACSQGVDGTGACVCSSGFVGDLCNRCQGGYFGPTCTACPSVAASSRAQCSGSGQCNDGIDGNGTCVCTIGFAGTACDLACPVEHNQTCGWGTCVGQQTCSCTWPVVLTPERGTCSSCAAHRWGPYCAHTCVCNHGVCNPVTGACVCTKGFWGVACEGECPGGSSNVCNGHGVCNPVTGMCTCYASLELGFFVGRSCTDCDPLYDSPTCRVPCPVDVVSQVVCAGRGRCFNGSCEGSCPRGYWGAACDYECPGGAATPCSGAGGCLEATGVCVCHHGVFGAACEHVCPGANAGSTCNNHGTCTSTGACVCDADVLKGYWSGTGCTECAPPYSGARCDVLCNPSSGVVVNSICVCVAGFVGAQCLQRCPTDAEGIVCARHGTCFLDTVSGSAACDCATHYYGLACEVWCTAEHCQASGQLYRAQCNPTDGACECQQSRAGYFTGASCDTCVDGYWGVECNYECPCSGRGTCARYDPVCRCVSGFGSGFWAGTSCDICAPDYIGTGCDYRNLEISDALDAVAFVDSVEVMSHFGGIAFHDPLTDVFIVGTTTLALFQTALLSTSMQLLQTLALPAAAVACSMVNETHLVVRLVPNNTFSFPPQVLLDRRWLATGVHPRVDAVPVAAAVRREWSYLSDDEFGDAVSFVVIDERTGCMASTSAASTTARLVVACATATSTSRQILELPGPANWMGAVGSSQFMVAWTSSATGAWGLIAFRFEPDASSPATLVFNTSHAQVPLDDCVTLGGCGSVSHCVSAAFNSVAYILCVARTVSETRNALVVFALNASNGLPTAALGNPVQVPEANVPSAAIVDVDAGNVIFAFEGPTTAMLCRVQVAKPLRMITLYPIARGALNERPTVLQMALNASTRTLWLHVGESGAVRAVAINLFSISSVAPQVFDRDGGATVTIKGLGFPSSPAPLCDFDSTVSATTPSVSSSVAIVTDSTTLLCNASSVVVLDATCTSLAINVWYGRRATRTTVATTHRPLTATLTSANTSDSGGHSAGFYAATTSITLVGFGFTLAASQPSCRLDDANGTVLAVLSAMPLTTTMAVCHQKNTTTGPTAPGSRLRYSHDGFVYSTSSIVYAVVGRYAGIRSLILTDGFVTATVTASSASLVPTIVIETVDALGNGLGWFDSDERTIRCSAVDPLILSTPDAAQPALTGASVLAASTVRGAATFRNLWLASLVAGETTLHFFVLSDLTTTASVVMEVVPGPPARIALAPLTPTSLWFSGVVDVVTLASFNVVLQDVVGNAIEDATLLAASPIRLHYTNVLPNPEQVGATEHRHMDMMGALDPDTSSFVYAGVATRSPFGSPIVLLFVSTDALIASLEVALPQTPCDASSFGVAGAFVCQRCPDHATCDGSPSITAAPSYWRGRVTSPFLYPCDTADSCLTSTTCSPAYEGPLCSSCAPGYGRVIGTCAICTSTTTPWVIIAVLIVAVVVGVWALALRSIAFTSVADVAASIVTVPEKRSTLALVAKVGLSYVQTLSLLPMHLVSVPWIQDALGSSGSWSVMTPGFFNVACVIGRRAVEEMRAVIALTGMVLFGCSLVAIVLAKRADMKFNGLVRPSVATSRAKRTKLAQAAPTKFLAADVSQVNVNFTSICQQATVLSNHAELLEEYTGDVEFGKKSIHDGVQERIRTGNSSYTTHVPLEVLVADHPDESGCTAIASVVPRPPLWSRVANTVLVSTVVVVFLLYPTIVQSAVRVLRCRTLELGDGAVTSVLAVDPAVSCSSDAYASSRAQASVVLALIGFGVPLFLPIAVLVARTATCEANMQRALQLFYFATGGYRVWFWESVVLARKAVVVIAIVLVDDEQVASLVCFWAIGVSLVLNVALRPWQDAALGALEAATLCALTLTSIALAMLAKMQGTASASFALCIVAMVALCNGLTMVLLVRCLLAAVVVEASAVEAFKDAMERNPSSHINDLLHQKADVNGQLSMRHPRAADLFEILDALQLPGVTTVMLFDVECSVRTESQSLDRMPEAGSPCTDGNANSVTSFKDCDESSEGMLVASATSEDKTDVGDRPAGSLRLGKDIGSSHVQLAAQEHIPSNRPTNAAGFSSMPVRMQPSLDMDINVEFLDFSALFPTFGDGSAPCLDFDDVDVDDVEAMPGYCFDGDVSVDGVALWDDTVASEKGAARDHAPCATMPSHNSTSITTPLVPLPPARPTLRSVGSATRRILRCWGATHVRGTRPTDRPHNAIEAAVEAVKQSAALLRHSYRMFPWFIRALENDIRLRRTPQPSFDFDMLHKCALLHVFQTELNYVEHAMRCLSLVSQRLNRMRDRRLRHKKHPLHLPKPVSYFDFYTVDFCAEAIADTDDD